MTATKRNALGKGLSALLQDNDTSTNRTETPVQKSPASQSVPLIPVGQIEANPFQPRTEFEQEALNELVASIKIHGIIQPITVRKLNDNAYQLISGERRLRASKMAGLKEVPAFIRTADDQSMLEMALIENIQRENLNSIEVAISFQRMIDECSLKQEELGERVGKNRTTVTNYLRLLKLPPIIQAAIRDQKITMGHAKAIINVDDADVQLYIFNEIMSKDLSVRKVEDLVRGLAQKPGKDKEAPKGISFEYQKIQDDLSSKFGAKVQVKTDGKGKGQINIPFLSNDDLNRILDMLDW